MVKENTENVKPVGLLCVLGTCSCVALGILTSCSGFMVPGLLTIVSGTTGYLITAYQVNDQNHQ
ncbi:MAG: hypothetical protein F6J93_01265 [Oscillatoria sp. SIO1A7]|nr:hypothetical protein [Oscillatoria sp. SIO1A7]